MKEKKYYPWVVVGLLWAVALLNYMDRQMLSTMQEAMKADIAELNKAEAFGALMAVFLWIYGIVSPFAGIVADKVDRKWLVVGSLFVWSAVTFLMGFAQTFDQLYWLRALMGVSEALYIPSALSLIADWHEGKSRSLAIGIHMTGLYVGQAIGGFGATVAMIFSWHTAFQGLGMVGIVYAVLLVLVLKENPKHRAETIPALMLLGLGHSLVTVIGAGVLFGIGFGIFDTNNMPILCQFISSRYRATAYGIMNMTGVFAGAAVTQILGKWTDGGSLGLGFALLSGVVAVALALQLIFLHPKTDNME